MKMIKYYPYETDILFVLNEDKIPDKDEIWKDLGLNYQWKDYDAWRELNKNRKFDEPYIEAPLKITGIFDLACWDSEWCYNSKDFLPITTIQDRLKYAYASMFDDNRVLEAVKKFVPEITEVTTATMRGTVKPYLKRWMNEYNFTLEDFIFNNKYIILSDSEFHHITEQLMDYDMIDWDKVAHCSAATITNEDEEEDS